MLVGNPGSLQSRDWRLKKEIESLNRVSRENTSSIRNGVEIKPVNQGQNQIVDNGHIMSRTLVFEAGMIFMQRNITAIVQAIFDLPVRSQHLEELLWGCLFSR